MTSPRREPVTVVGAGIFGLACAFTLLQRGAGVRVIEAARVGAGASGGHVGALAPHAPENWNEKKALQLDSLMAAAGFWAEVQAAANLSPGYARTGRIQPVPDAATAARLPARLAAAREHWPAGITMQLTDRPEGALIPPSPSGLWLTDNLTARVSPRAACAALAAAIRALGGEIIEGRPAGVIEGPAIWATGAAGLESLGRELGRKIGQGVKGQSLLLDLAVPDSPQVFADGIHIVPHADGTTAIGSTSENSYAHEAPDEQADALLACAVALCPALRGAAVLDIWAGIRPRARSRAPVLAPYPGHPGQIIANGGFKIGFGMAPLIAARAADLVLTGRADLPPTFALP